MIRILSSLFLITRPDRINHFQTRNDQQNVASLIFHFRCVVDFITFDNWVLLILSANCKVNNRINFRFVTVLLLHTIYREHNAMGMLKLEDQRLLRTALSSPSRPGGWSLSPSMSVSCLQYYASRLPGRDSSVVRQGTLVFFCRFVAIWI